jgi:glycerate 2-kinase
VSVTVKKPLPHILNHRQHIDYMIDGVLEAIDPAVITGKHISLSGSQLTVGSSTHDTTHGRVYLIAVGKASIPMTVAAVEQLDHTLHKGILITKSRDREELAQRLAGNELSSKITAYGAGHPVSDQRSVSATAAVIDLVNQAGEKDLVLCLISGGASALLSRPVLPLSHWQALTNALLASGCTINELNTVRKQLDVIKGGGLARRVAPAACLSLILSDVVGNPLDIIASGPTVANPDKPEAARHVLLRHQLDRSLEPEIWRQIEDHLADAEARARQFPTGVENYIIGDVGLAAEAAARAAIELGFTTTILTTHLEGEAREVGRMAAALAKDAPAGACLLFGGETTVTLRGHGKGGRNQELALAAGIALEGYEDAVVASFATDGDDGPTDAAGAIITGKTLSLARSKGVDAQRYLDNNDSYTFFDQVGGLIQTGQTGTNVNDLLFILKYGPARA